MISDKRNKVFVTRNSDSISYSNEDRRNRAMKYARLCKMLTDRGIIAVCCTISMYDEVKEHGIGKTILIAWKCF